MGTSTEAMFGEDGRPAAAAPGSYGIPPRGYRLPAETRLGAVALQVADPDRSAAYYEAVLGFRVASRDGRVVRLTAHGSDRVLIELHGHPGAHRAGHPPRLGLYHFAILLPDRASLGRFVRHLGAIGARAGAGDHLVSEAFYLQDPDNLGIEVYADRPRAEWQRVGRELMMATDPVDVTDLLAHAGDAPWEGMPAGAVIGHVHLHVGELAAADAFYAEGIGFDRTVTRYPGALFLGAGGYHHHLGNNTWAGRGAASAGEGDARLLHWTIELPAAADVAQVSGNLTAAGYVVERIDARAFMAPDPWGTHVLVRSRDGS